MFSGQELFRQNTNSIWITVVYKNEVMRQFSTVLLCLCLEMWPDSPVIVKGVFTQWLPGSLSPQLGWVFWSRPRCRSPPQCSPLSSDPQSSPETQRTGECKWLVEWESRSFSEDRFHIWGIFTTNNIPSVSGWLCGWHLLIPDHCYTWRT